MTDESKNKELIPAPPKKPEYDEEEELGGSMTFLEHLEELRERLIRALIAFAVASVICFMFSEQLLNLLIWPLPGYLKEDVAEYQQKTAQVEKSTTENAIGNGSGIVQSPTNAIADTVGSVTPEDSASSEEKATSGGRRGSLTVLSVFEGIMVYVKISIIGGIFLAFPFIFYEAWMFIAPGLYKREKKVVLPLVVYAWICFILGGLFCFFVIYPFILVYMAEVFTPKVAEIQWSLSNYVSFTTNLLLAFGVVFEQPVLFALLAKIGIVTASGLSKFRSYAVVIIFTVAALITPPDPFSQTTCAIPMWGLYEISILVVRMIEKGRKEESGEYYAG